MSEPLTLSEAAELIGIPEKAMFLCVAIYKLETSTDPDTGEMYIEKDVFEKWRKGK